MARAGGCHRFEVRGRSPIVGIEAELPLPAVDDPFRQDDAPCVVDRDGGGVTVLRPPAVKTPPRGRPPAPARGALSLRLRDMDLADVFFVLHLLTGQGFLVDEDVRGRVERRGQPGRPRRRPRPPGPGRRRRLSARTAAPRLAQRGARGARRRPRARATPITFALKRAAVRDVLAVIAEADAAAPLAPAGRGRADQPLGRRGARARTSARPSSRWRAWPGRPAAMPTRLPPRRRRRNGACSCARTSCR